MLRFCVLLLAAVVMIPSSLNAADEKKPEKKDPRKLVAVDLAGVDEDFHYQGEYLGAASHSGQCTTLGLQVAALGGGDFQAVEHVGGLPGYGWPVGGTRIKYSGTREGTKLTLTGESKNITIENGHAVIWTADGKCPIGGARKVHRQSPTIGWAPPRCATVLFDGTNDDLFKDNPFSDDGIVQKDALTKDPIGDMQLHVEFRLPYMPYASEQGRSNSGVYIQTRYEVQILDSFGFDKKINGIGALYTQREPDLNMALPPLSWQTYDIWFKGPRFDSDGKKSVNGRLTAWLNGVPVQDDIEIQDCTGAGKRVGEGAHPLPLKLQQHGNQARFRNVWVINHGSPSQPSAPAAVETITSTQTQPNVLSLSLFQSIGLTR